MYIYISEIYADVLFWLNSQYSTDVWKKMLNYRQLCLKQATPSLQNCNKNDKMNESEDKMFQKYTNHITVLIKSTEVKGIMTQI